MPQSTSKKRTVDMAVSKRLRTIRGILVAISERPDCVEITGYNPLAIRIFVGALDRAISRYKSEAQRVKKYYRR